MKTTMTVLFAGMAAAALAAGRVEFRECPKCDKRIRIDLAEKKAYVNLSRLEGADRDAVAERAARLLDMARIAPSRDPKLRPLMGWSSWNTFGVEISESLILETAQAMATNGLKAAGYTYVNIDDGFFWGHGEDGVLRFHPKRFPNGMKPVVDGIHALGLKAGIYSDAGADTCGSMWGGSSSGGKDVGGIGAGLYGHDAADCKLHFKDLGFDFIKVDYCGGQRLKLDERVRYTEIANAIKATGRTDVRLNICRWAFPGTWAADIAESWRTTGDIRANWKSVKKIIDENLYLSAYAKPGHYNDMDMLEVGQHVGQMKTIFGKHGDTGLTEVEEATHFGMWCMMSSPLLIGCDVRDIPESTKRLITNPYLLAVNQNDLGCQAYVVNRDGDAYVLVKDADIRFGKSRYVALYNASGKEHEFTVRAAELDLGGAVDAFDLVEMADVGRFEDHVSVTVAPHAAKFYRFDAERRIARTVYEAESAYLAEYQELHDATKIGSAFPDQCKDASGGVVVRYLGNRESNDLVWTDVWVDACGRYELEFTCFTADDRAFYVQVDGGAPVRLDVRATGGGAVAVKTAVDLDRGAHVVRLSNASGWMPDMDKMTVALLSRPECRALDDDGALAAARSALAKMTLEEKTQMLAGSGTMTLPAVPRAGVFDEWTMSDNSSTVRPALSRWSWSYVEPRSANTKLPSLSALAQTWDVAWARRHGEVLGAECRERGVDQLLGPGVNIMRTPLCGRNWEYLGEDPVLAAKMCVPMIKGVQDYGVAATVKHYCLNDQELNRGRVDTHADDRTLNEIYLPAFRAAVKEAGVLAVMSSYNKVDGVYASENRYTLNGILRDRWGFKGLVVTDWGGQHSTEFAAMNGCGVEMHRGDKIKYLCNPSANRFPLADAVRRGEVPAATVDEMALHTLYVMAKTGFLTGAPRGVGSRNTPEHQRVARDEGAESVVLLKNERGVLPLDAKSLGKVLVVGLGANLRQCHKGCSGEGNVPYEVTLFDALTNRLAGAEVTLMPFCEKLELAATDTSNATEAGGHVELKKSEGWCSEEELRAAAEAADAVIVFTGTELGYQENMESEGRDRAEFNLPEPLQRAMHTILDWGLKRVVVISRSGSPVGYTWTDKADTMLQSSYLGMEEGNALADVIFGDVNPCGKLVQTWPKCYADTAVAHCGTYNADNVTYNERFYVGYRWHDKANIEPLFPFGYGLSYTSFGYGDVSLSEGGEKGAVVARIPLTNVGKVAGKEVVQLYVSCLDARVERCAKELKAFAKVALAPGETKTVELRVSPRDLAYWDEFAHRFRSDAGEYELLIGSSSADIRARARFTLRETSFFAD